MYGDLLTDCRVAMRGLRRSPGFAIAAIAAIALGTGANTAIFSAVEAVLLHPIPGADTHRLVALQTDLTQGGRDQPSALAPETVYDLADRHDVFAGVGGYRAGVVTVGGPSAPQRVSAIQTVAAFFETVEARPALGRVYSMNDVEHGDPRVVVLGNGFWRSTMGGDSAVIGKTLRINDSTYRVVGVLPATFAYPHGVSIYTPHQVDPDFSLGRDEWSSLTVTAVGRLQSGVSAGQLRAGLDAEMLDLRQRHPIMDSLKIDEHLIAVPFVDWLAGALRPILRALLACVGLVLLIACANVASLQLIRTAARAREIAVRRALGASAGAVTRQIALESLLVSLVAGCLGVGLGRVAIAIIGHSDASQVATLSQVRLDVPVLAWSLGVAIATALVFGIGPLMRALGVSASDALKSESRAVSAGLGRSRLLRGVVIAQVALAVVLLLGGATAWRSLARTLAIDPGFQPAGVLTMRIVLPPDRYHQVPWDSTVVRGPTTTAFFATLIDRLRSMPGFVAVGTVEGAPFGYIHENEHGMTTRAAGRPHSASDPIVDIWGIGGDYFRAMDIPVEQGRPYASGEESCVGSDPVVIDAVLARRLFARGPAVGKLLDNNDCARTIVGVVGASKKADLAAPDHGAMYWSYGKHAPNDLTVVVRTGLSLASASRMMRAAVASIDSTVAAGAITPLARDIQRSVAPQRLASNVLSTLALLATVLSALGLFGVLSYGIAQRARELGIRAALGAAPDALVRLVLADGTRLVAVGVAAGVLLYLWVARFASSAVYGVSVWAPTTVVGGAAVVAAVALVACYLPARRAARIDPASVLRSE